ncbi:hypothetical protein LOZ66_004079 [Ophidiomyces ophidiicola]|nr:hypothetical protein LOZ66_004079 [Ophidiomyces ophidiicola]
MTLKQLPDHFDALRTNGAMLRAKLFNRAGAPWEGDSLSLRLTIIQVCTCWPLPYDDALRELGPCPVQHSEEQRNDFISQYNQEQEKLEELSDIRAHIGIDSQGWVPDVDHLVQAKAVAQSIKAGLLAHSATDIERIALQQHFPFDDHDEKGLTEVTDMSVNSLVLGSLFCALQVHVYSWTQQMCHTRFSPQTPPSGILV